MPTVPPMVLDANLKRPLHRQIEDQLRAAILEGRLPAHSRLPGIRQLAAQYGVARITVRTAYDQLCSEGYVTARIGSGTRVAADIPDDMLGRFSVDPAQRGRPRFDRDRLPPASDRMPLTTYVSNRPEPGSLTFDFRPGRPGLDLFPAVLWERLLRGAWRDLSRGSQTAALDYADPAGNPELRSALMTHLAGSRAVRGTMDQVIVTGGSQAAFDIASRLWLGVGRSCVVEDPGYPMAWRVLRASGTELVPTPVDDHGLVTHQLPSAADGALVTPSWQYPAGGTLPLGRRIELLRWAKQTNGLIIEDDYDSELRYEGRPLASLQGLDNEGRVLYVGTLSKVAFPGLRLGYTIVPMDMVDRFLAVLELSHRGASAVEQLAMARFIEGGHLDRHLRRVRLAYAERQSILVDAIRHSFGGSLSVSPQPAGMHLVARLSETTVPASRLATAARRLGVGVTPMSTKRLTAAGDDELLLGYTGIQADDIREGMERLGIAYRQVGAHRPAQQHSSRTVPL